MKDKISTYQTEDALEEGVLIQLTKYKGKPVMATQEVINIIPKEEISALVLTCLEALETYNPSDYGDRKYREISQDMAVSYNRSEGCLIKTKGKING